MRRVETYKRQHTTTDLTYTVAEGNKREHCKGHQHRIEGEEDNTDTSNRHIRKLGIKKNFSFKRSHPDNIINLST